MRLQDVTSSGPVTRLGLFVGQYMPRWVGYGLARVAANLIASRKPEVYWTVRANLRHVVGPGVDDRALHQIVRHVFFHAGQTYYDFFRAVGQPPEAILEAIHIPISFIEQIRSGMARGQGVLLLGAHMSNFDLAILGLNACGLPVQALSLTDPGPGFRLLNRLRAAGSIEVTPITPESLRAAVRRLAGGGLVMTGVDRPVPDGPSVRRDQNMVEFFGQPSYLTLGPVRLALMAGAVVFVGICRYDSNKGYALDINGPIEMIRTDDRRRDVHVNARRVFAILEGYVRAHPEQWMMFHPVWPEPPAAQGGNLT